MTSKDVCLLFNTWCVLHFDLSILHVFMNEMILWKYVFTSSMKTGLVVRALTNLLSTFSLSSFNILYNNFLSYTVYLILLFLLHLIFLAFDIFHSLERRVHKLVDEWLALPLECLYGIIIILRWSIIYCGILA